jgi:hypothetical protein
LGRSGGISTRYDERMSDDDTSVLRRAREVLATLGVGESEPQGRSALEAVAFQVGESLVRWRDSGAVRRFLGVPPGRDQVVVAGGSAWLAARVGTVAEKGASGVRFFVDGRAVGECSLSGPTAAGIEVQLDRVGLRQVELQPLNAAGVPLAPRGTVGASRIQVVDGPVLAVDAALLLDPQWTRALRRLASLDVETFYFDVDPSDRTELIQPALIAAGLPDAALLTHPDLGEDVDNANTDFSRVFGLTTVR